MKSGSMWKVLFACVVSVSLSGCLGPAPVTKKNPAGKAGKGDGPISEAEGKDDRRIYMWSEDPRKNDPGPTYTDPGPLPPEPWASKQVRLCNEAEKKYNDARAQYGPNDSYTKECLARYKKLKAELDKESDWINKPR